MTTLELADFCTRGTSSPDFWHPANQILATCDLDTIVEMPRETHRSCHVRKVKKHHDGSLAPVASARPPEDTATWIPCTDGRPAPNATLDDNHETFVLPVRPLDEFSPPGVSPLGGATASAARARRRALRVYRRAVRSRARRQHVAAVTSEDLARWTASAGCGMDCQ